MSISLGYFIAIPTEKGKTHYEYTTWLFNHHTYRQRGDTV